MRYNPSESNNRLIPLAIISQMFSGIWPSLLHKIALIPATLEGFQARTACFGARHGVSIRFRSALWLGHPKYETLEMWIFSVFFGSASCGMILVFLGL